TCTHRYSLVKVHFHRPDPEISPKDFIGAYAQVFFRRPRYRQSTEREIERIALDDLEDVRPGNRIKACFNIVIAVGAPAKDIKAQVDLARRERDHVESVFGGR